MLRPLVACLFLSGCTAHVRIEAVDVAGLPVADAIVEARGRAAGSPWEFELDPGPLDVVVVHDAQRIKWHGKVRRGKRVLRIGPMPEGKPGDRSQKSISDGLGKVSRDLESCYADELRGNRRLAGRIVIRFTIEPDGKTSGVYVEDSTVVDEALESCMVGAFARLDFVETSEGLVVVRFPIELRSIERVDRRIGPD